MADISVIVCTHNPRHDYLRRVLQALQAQTIPQNRWELLLVDNASDSTLANIWDLSWHDGARHVRENALGLTPARLRGIAEASGNLLVFLDDDNVARPDFLEQASNVSAQYPYLGVFGAGILEPEFEVQPSAEIRPRVQRLGLRSVPISQWSNNARDYDLVPWGAGLCVTRQVANSYRQVAQDLHAIVPLDRNGKVLFSGGDDVFSWVAVCLGYGFGIFPQLRVTHLIAAGRVSRDYVLRLVHEHAFSASVRHFLLEGIRPRGFEWSQYAQVLLHGAKNGRFSMKCQWAVFSGEDKASRFILEKGLQPLQFSCLG